MPSSPGDVRAHRRRNRLLTTISSSALTLGLLVVLPVTTSTAEDPPPVAVGVQDIPLGTPNDPATGVDVLDPSASPAPPATAESPSDASEPSAQPETSAPATSEPATGGAPADELPPASKEETSDELMPVPEGSQTLKLEPKDTAGFASAGISWVGDVPLNGIALQARTRDAASGEWSGWTELSVNRNTVDNPANDQRQGSDPFWFGTSDGVEVAVTIMPGTSIKDLKVTLIDPKEVANDQTPSAAPPSSAGAATPMPSVYTRAQWGADESKMTWSPRYASTIKAATIHHSADSNNYSAEDVPRIIRSIYQYQAVTLGWGDIGYNVLVDKFGRAWEGRVGGLDQPVTAAHAGGFNQYTFGVSMIGNYDVAQVPAAVQEKVAQLVAWKLKLFGVNPKGTTQLTQSGGGGTTAKFQNGQTVTFNTIFGHRDSGNTACPGKYGYAMLPALRDRVAAITATLPPPPTYDPEGAVHVNVAASGKATIAGWTLDRNAILAPVDTAVVVDGKAYYLSANEKYTPLASYGIPGDHGFTLTLDLSPGKHDICVIGTNVGPGTTRVVDCKSVTYEAKPALPIGALDVRNNGNGTVNLNGWAYDASAPKAPVIVVLTIDGGSHIYHYASGPRPELAQYGFPGDHGFNFNYPIGTDGSHKVCMYAVDIGPGDWISTGCKQVTVTGNDPQGGLFVAKSGSTIKASGYAFDANDLYAHTTVMITLNGNIVSYAVANQPYPALAYYGVPGNHGFASSFTASSGKNSVCLFIGNIGPGASTLAQCTNV